MENLASIKTHDPCRTGVLVELSGEFDVSCWKAFRYALRRATSFGQPIFLDLSGVTFMDSLHIRELAIWATMGAAPLRLCRPSWQVERSVTACDLEDGIVILPDDDPGYEAVVTEACRFRQTCVSEARRAFS